MEQQQDNRSVFSSPLYAFSVPENVLNSLKPGTLLDKYYQSKNQNKNLESQQQSSVTRTNALSSLYEHQPTKSSLSSSSSKEQKSTTGSAPSRGCATCDISAFPSVAEQRSHFRTDWHRYNVKLRLAGSPIADVKKPVSESQFNEMLESLSDSISGSDSSSEDDDDQDSDGSDNNLNFASSSTSSVNAVSRLLRKNDISNNSNNNNAQDDQNNETQGQGSPFAWYTADSVESNVQLGFYRALFPSYSRNARYQNISVNQISDRQLQPIDPRITKKNKGKEPDTSAVDSPTDPESRTWTILMIGGGHFAGMVVSLVPKYVNKGSGKYERESIVLERKTFHRYTTRRKQGGSQSTNDNAKGNAKSAGAQLRRYGQAALQDEIRELLDSWSDLIEKSETIFVRASRSNMRIFTGYDEAPFNKNDDRLRSIPFPTRRPTVHELERVFDELTQVKVIRISNEEIEKAYSIIKQDEEKQEAKIKKDQEKAAAAKSKAEAAKSAKEQSILSSDEQNARDQWSKVLEMVRKKRLEALKGWVLRNGTQIQGDYLLDRLPQWLENEHKRGWVTLLHIASVSDSSEIVAWLLSELNADPTIKPETGGQTAYEVATSKATRNAFRRYRAQEPNKWDWDVSARVPSALTEEQETEQRNKNKERRTKMKEQTATRRKEKEETRKKEEEAQAAIKAAETQKEMWRKAASNIRTGPQRLGGAGSGGLPLGATIGGGNSGMSAEARARLERERRARAAEARLGKRS